MIVRRKSPTAKNSSLTNGPLWVKDDDEALGVFFQSGSFIGREQNNDSKALLLDLRLQLRLSEARFRRVVETSADWIWEIAQDSGFTYVSSRVKQFLGYEATELIGRRFDELLPALEAAQIRGKPPQVGARRKTFALLRDILLAKQGKEVVVETNGTSILADDRYFTGYLGLERYVTEREHADIHVTRERFSTIFNCVSDGIFLSDLETGNFVDVNVTGCDMFGYNTGELKGCSIVTLTSGIWPYTQAGMMEMVAKVQAKGPQIFEWQCKRKDGEFLWVEISLSISAVSRDHLGLAVVRDISDRKRANETIAHMANYDLLTGFANRRVFVEALDQAIARTRGAQGIAILCLDLDHFKDVNDTLGHPVGDLLVQAVADRLRVSVRGADTVARFGGDEFAVLLTDIHELAEAVVSDRLEDAVGKPIVLLQEAATTAGAMADKILKALEEPFSIQGNEIRSGASIGIGVYGPDSLDAETMLSHADVALYRAKSEGRGIYRFFTDNMDTEIRARIQMCTELRQAIALEQLFLAYQPLVDIDTGRIVGLEALVRWHHPTRGDLGPDAFIHAAEISGLIIPLGHWVMREACRQAKQWSEAGIAPPPIAINVSAVQFKLPGALESDIAANLMEFALPASHLELELTESVLMEAACEDNNTLLRLRRAGHHIVIDDFGCGYSSLDYLRLYPVDRIKIAQCFTLGIGTGSGCDAIIRAALSLARELSIEVVVEGVETVEQLELLRGWGCRLAQGYYFSKPLAPADLTALLRIGRVARPHAGTAKIAAMV
jgi:diguanylate cyclase (GGDEF)-like protein/PAS domain S-box-containing protein